MSDDLRSGTSAFRAFLTLYLKGWVRSRQPWLWLVLVAAMAWLDRELGPAGGGWWANWVALMALTGFLAGYDAYLRLREDGSLRLLILAGAPRGAATLGFLAGGTLLAGGALLAFGGYLIAVHRAPIAPDALAILLLIWGGALGFVAYAQLGSLVLPRDTAAVLGLLVILFGAGPWDRWLPPGAPHAVRALAHGASLLLPTTHRIAAVLAEAGTPPSSGGTLLPRLFPLAVALAQIAAAAAAIRWVLGRRFLLTRSDDE